MEMVLACKMAVLPQNDGLRCIQDPEAIPAVRVLITDASCPTLEDHIEGMEFESHYGDMRTKIQEVALSLCTAFCMQFLSCECTGLLGLAPLLLVPACTQLQFIEAHASTIFSADLRCRQCKKLCRKQCRRLCMMV